MTDVIAHRGPDGEGFHLAEGIGLGVRRLAIVDLHTGDQPIANADGSLTLICNGEIYTPLSYAPISNSAGIVSGSKSDVEVILATSTSSSARRLPRLRGMFAFALWDQRQRRLLLARIGSALSRCTTRSARMVCCSAPNRKRFSRPV